jgi:thymidylate kinase
MTRSLGADASRATFVAIDGFDGSGKTTLTTGLRDYFTSQGSSCVLIGRRLADSDEVTDALTNLILSSDGAGDATDEDANAHIRLARLHQRIALARVADVDYVFFDRWIASDLSRLALATAERHASSFLHVHQAVPIDMTVRLVVDFATAWHRINARDSNELSPSEKRGEARNQMLFNQLDTIWDRNWIEPVISVGSTQPPEEVLALVAGRIEAMGRSA